MFLDCARFNIPLEHWNVSSVVDMSGMFSGCVLLTSGGGDNWKTAKVTDMAGMFAGCTSLVTVYGGQWDTANVTNMSTMFSRCRSLESIGCENTGPWNVSRVENMSHMFLDCVRFNSPLERWNVSKVKVMTQMFAGCTSFNQSLNAWNVASVADMSEMFRGCVAFDQLLYRWNVSAFRTVMYHMFDDYTQAPNIWNWTGTYDMDMFATVPVNTPRPHHWTLYSKNACQKILTNPIPLYGETRVRYLRSFGIHGLLGLPRNIGTDDKNDVNFMLPVVEEAKKTLARLRIPQGHRTISGLLSLSVYSSVKYNMRILLLGEAHTFNGRCPDWSRYTSAHTFVREMLNLNEGMIVDLFMEEDRVHTEHAEIAEKITKQQRYIPEGESGFYDQGNGYMSQLFRELTNIGCYTNNCMYSDYVRFHYADVRAKDEYEQFGITAALATPSTIAQYMTHVFRLAHNETDGVKIIQYLAKINQPKYAIYNTPGAINSALQDVHEDLRIIKQLESIRYPEVKAYLLTRLKRDLQRDYSIIGPGKLQRLTNLAKVKAFFTPAIRDVVELSVDMMDTYLIARLFRDFKYMPEKKINGPIRNAIIYAGNKHIQNYGQMLTDLDFTKNYTEHNNNDICLTIDVPPEAASAVATKEAEKHPQRFRIRNGLCYRENVPRYDEYYNGDDDDKYRHAEEEDIAITFASAEEIIKRPNESFLSLRLLNRALSRTEGMQMPTGGGGDEATRTKRTFITQLTKLFFPNDLVLHDVGTLERRQLR